MLLRTEYLIQTTQLKLNNLHPHIRNERGLIDGIGKVQKWLFGTLDAEDGKRYDESIATLEQSQKNIIQELNLQISLSKRLIINYNKTITTISKNQEHLEHALEEFQSSVKITITNLSSFIGLQGIISQINLDCQNVITFIDNIEDAITFAKLNTLHNSIISSCELEEMLKYLKSIYNESEIPSFKNILSYYQLLGSQVTFSNTRLIFAIHVPIIRPEVLTFYRLYPIIQNHQMFVPKYPYLAHTKLKKQFENEECPLLEDIYFCTEHFYTEDECTLQLIQGDTAKTCKTLNINVQEPIIEQVTQDEILIIPSREEKLFSKCKTDQYIEVTNPVLIKIPRTCEIQINQKRFFNDQHTQQGKPLILPKLKIGNFATPKPYETPNFTKLNLNELHEINNMAQQLMPITKTDHLVTKTTMIGVISTIIIITLILILIKKRKAFKIIIHKWTKKNGTQSEGEAMEEVELPKNSQNNSVIF